MVDFGNDWNEVLNGEFEKDYYLALRKFLIQEYKTRRIFPHINNIFNAQKTTSYEKTSVVILGQDPYHEINQAHGLAFSVQPGCKIPPSLVNIFKELHTELNTYIPNNGCLTHWANQGVLLLNTVLTVREGEANSHKNKGWEIYTDQVIKKLNEKSSPVIFILWGNNAKSKEGLIDTSRHYVLKSNHPSPLSASRGFFGCNHFIKTNEILKALGKPPIDWQIENI